MAGQREKKRDVLYVLAAVLFCGAVAGCRKQTPAPAAAATGGPSESAGVRSRVLFVDSYHEGYPWNEGILDGVRNVLDGRLGGRAVELEVIRMDAKRNTSEDFGKEAAQRAAAFIELWKPDCIIAADDAASKYLIGPYYRDGRMPVVFCGVNWDASVYGFPCSNVTGILEISLIPSLLETLRAHARGPRVGILGADNLSNRKEAENYRLRFGLEPTCEVFVADFAEWKQRYLELQEEVDMLILAPPSFIMSDSDMTEARGFVIEHTAWRTGSRRIRWSATPRMRPNWAPGRRKRPLRYSTGRRRETLR